MALGGEEHWAVEGVPDVQCVEEAVTVFTVQPRRPLGMDVGATVGLPDGVGG